MVLHMFLRLLVVRLLSWRLRKAAILDLSKMADIEGAQLGSLTKLVADDHI